MQPAGTELEVCVVSLRDRTADIRISSGQVPVCASTRHPQPDRTAKLLGGTRKPAVSHMDGVKTGWSGTWVGLTRTPIWGESGPGGAAVGGSASRRAVCGSVWLGGAARTQILFEGFPAGFPLGTAILGVKFGAPARLLVQP